VRLRDVASSSCAVVVALLRDLVQQPPVSSGSAVVSEDLMIPMRPLWTKSVAAAVCSKDLTTRTNSADYLVPELLKVDCTSGPHLMREIRANYSAGALVSGDGSYTSMLWGLVQVTLHARALALAGKDIVHEGDHQITRAELSEQEVIWACVSDDVDLRLASLTLLTGERSTGFRGSLSDLR
jgi:hypothetical protein